MAKLMIYLLILALTLQETWAIQTSNNMPVTMIGAMFPKRDNSSLNSMIKEPLMRKAFSLALRIINECSYQYDTCQLLSTCDPELDCRIFHRVRFTAVMTEVEDDLISALKTFNDLIAKNNFISALIGPHYTLSSNYVQGLCDMHDLPNIFVMPEYHRYSNHSINVYPDAETLGIIYTHLVKSLYWTNFLILYEKTENLVALEKLLKLYPARTYDVYAIYLGSGPNFTEAVLTAKQNNIGSIIVDCSFNILPDVLQHIQDVGMMTENYEFIITSFDLHGVDLHPYLFSGANVTGMRLVDPEDPVVKTFVGEHLDELGISKIEDLRVEEALMFDAVTLLTQAYKDLRYGYPIKDNQMHTPVTDAPTNSWPHGLSLRNYILYNSVNGLTGPVVLDGDGHRRRFKVDILNLHSKDGLVKVGKWDPDEGFEELSLMRELSTEHFKVLITLTEPYGMLVKNDKHTTGNDRYEGFVVDIIKELSNEIKFNYSFYVQVDKNNGKCEKPAGSNDCKCGGMMGKLLSGDMDMAITDLTITEDRQMCIEFSTAFWNLGMSILFKKPEKAVASPLSFLSPFHWAVWIYLIAIYMFASGLFFLLGRLCPDEWTNQSPCIDEPSELYNQFTVNNSLWFTIGALMQQGSEIAPIGMSTRTLAGCWWFFCLIITSTYTANLAAFLTCEKPAKEFTGLKDLYNQSRFKFGAKSGGSTLGYFESSSNPDYKELAMQMKSPEWKEYMVDDNKIGVELAEKGDYAFLMESATIEYHQLRNCKVEQVGDLIDQKSYAIAYKKGFKYGKQISTAISILQERLVIKDLYDRWWKSGAKCFEGNKEDDDKDPAMSLTQLQGVFMALAIGVAVSVILTGREFFQGIHKMTKKENGKFSEIMSDEIKLIKKLKSVKPVLRREKSTESNLSEMSCDLTMTTQA